MPADPPLTPRFSHALEDELRTRAATRRRPRRSPLGPLVVAAALVVALAFVLLPSADEGGEQAAREPAPLTVTEDQLMSGDRALYRRLQGEFEERGKRLVVREKAVAPGAPIVGGVWSIQTPGPRRERGEPLVVEELEGPVIVVLAVADPDERIEGLSICETIPRLSDLVEGDDPQGSIRRLREAGFRVTVRTVPWDKPGDQDVVIGVYGPGGRNTGVPPDTKRLTLEVGSPGGGHGASGSC